MEYYNRIWEHRDPRVEDWPLMSSAIPTVLMCLTYVFIAKIVGPYYMRDRPSFKIQGILIFYNFAQVLFSIWMFYEALMGIWLGNYNFRCQPVDFSYNIIALRLVNMGWWYYVSKFTEFFDTFFFILRKKEEHISLLHVVHHGIMPFNTWLAVRFLGGGHSAVVPLLNTLVHVFMYFYYMVSAMGPSYSKAIAPWKKYLTTIQLVQFVGIMVHAFQLFFIECDYPITFAYWIGGHAVFFFILFFQFYRKSYITKTLDRKNMRSTCHENMKTN